MLTLQWPWLLLLLPAPWLVWRFWPAANSDQGRAQALKVPFYAELSQTAASANANTRRFGWRGVLLTLIWLLLLLAAVRPQWLGEPQAQQHTGRDLMLAVDISGSMEMDDMRIDGRPVDRLRAVKTVMSDFVARREGDRLGLILFGTQAYVQAPLTFDHPTIERFLGEAEIGFAGEKTAIGDAIGLSVKRLLASEADSRVLVLLTDGANTAGEVSPLEAARVAAEQGIRIYTLGFGAEEIEVPSLFGSRRVNPSAELDEEMLTRIAEDTGGRYFRARNLDELQAIYQSLDELEPTRRSGAQVRPQIAYFHWPLALALLLSLLWAAGTLWRERREAGT